MPSSYTSNLRLTLPLQGELAGSWGNTVNTGITTLTDTAIAGTSAVTMTDADHTLTTVNGATDQARAMFITLTGTLTSARSVICPSNSKLYYVTNNTTGGFSITFKTSAGGGISIPNGKRTAVYCDGTNVLDGETYLSSITLGTALPVASGGTGATTSTGTGSVVLSSSPTLVTPALGTPTSGTLTSCTGLPISTGVSGLGTGIATALAVNTGSAGAPVLFNGALGTPTSGTVTYLTGTASININGTVGATTASSGAFTTVTASGDVTFNGNTTIGNADTDTITQAASYVTGTQLKSAKTATNTLNLAAYDVDGTAYTNLVTLTASNTPTLTLTSTGVGTIDNMSIGATTPSTGAFTTLSASGDVAFNGNVVIGNAETDTITQNSRYVSGTKLKTGILDTQNFHLSAYDVDGLAYTNLVTLTASNTPTLNLTSTGVGTINNMSVGATTPSTGAFTTLSASGVTTVSAGSAGAPAITTTGSTNTGIYFPSTDTIGFSVGGIDAVFINQYGNMNIPGGGNNNSNTTLGEFTLVANTDGAYNVAIGISSGNSNQSGTNNTVVGTQSFISNTTGSFNTVIGGDSLASSNGSYNTAVGYSALGGNTTGSGNTAISPVNNAGTYAPVFNPTTQTNRFCMGSTAVTNAYIQVAWTVVSDARDKTDFAPVPHGLDFVTKLKPFAYRYKVSRDATEGHGPIRYGFKAQDVLELEGANPVIVDNEDSEKLRFNDQSMLAVLVNAIKELKAEFDAYKLAHP